MNQDSFVCIVTTYCEGGDMWVKLLLHLTLNCISWSTVLIITLWCFRAGIIKKARGVHFPEEVMHVKMSCLFLNMRQVAVIRHVVSVCRRFAGGWLSCYWPWTTFTQIVSFTEILRCNIINISSFSSCWITLLTSFFLCDGCCFQCSNIFLTRDGEIRLGEENKLDMLQHFW